MLSIIIMTGIISVGRERVLAALDDSTGLLYTITGTEAQIIGFKDPSGFTGELTIPSTLGGASVTSIQNSALAWKTSLTSVSIPNSVTAIGNSAFYGCSSLVSVSMSTAVTHFGVNLFWGCSNLTGISIPDGVTVLDDSAFDGCSALSSITIPASVTTLGLAVFYQCSNLAVVTFKGSVTSVGGDSFEKDNSSQIIFVVPSGTKAYYEGLLTTGTLGSSTAVITEESGVPNDLQAVSAGPTSVNLSWSAVPGVTGYAIYRSKMAMIARGTPTATSVSANYADTGLTTGTLYYYRIRSYKTIGTVIIYSASTSTVSAMPAAPPTPTPTPTLTPAPTPTLTPAPTPTPKPQATQTTQPTQTATASPTPAITAAPSLTAAPAEGTPTNTPTAAVHLTTTGVPSPAVVSGVTPAPKKAAKTTPTYVYVLIGAAGVVCLSGLAAGVLIIRRKTK